MSQRDPAACLEPETIAAFAEGKLQRHEVPAVLAHLEGCPTCMSALTSANAEFAGSRPAIPWRRILAAAAIVTVVLLAVPAVQRLVRPAPGGMDRLVALAPESARIVEPRLSGGFAWAPYGGPMRDTEAAGDAQRLKLGGLAGELVERADRDRTPATQHDAGVALVLIERPLDAVTRLHASVESNPGNAKGWSDLAAARYAAALRLSRPSLYPEALAAADRALELDRALPEALFNRALILERLGLSGQARTAWQQYLAVDPSSPWAAEARERLGKLPATTGAAQFEREQPRLEAAARRGDAATVDAIVRNHAQLSRTWAEFGYLGSDLTVARVIGDSLVRVSGETLLRDAVRAVDTGDAAALGAAHALYRRGRTTYSKRLPTEAEPDLREAARRFAAGGSPMALVARYYAANTRFDQNDVSGARRELEQLIAETRAHPQYIALGAQLRWELSLCSMVDDDWAGALPHVEAARAGFERLGERNSLGFMDFLLADTLTVLGRTEDGWNACIRSFSMLSRERQSGRRLVASVGGAVRMETRAGRLESARALVRIEEALAREEDDDIMLVDALVRDTIVSADAGDDAAAAACVREARSVAGGIADPRLRAYATADVDFAGGAAALRADPRAARTLLTRAIDFYATAERPLFLPHGHLLRARAALRLGDRDAALRDLENGIDTAERHRVRFAASVIGTGALDAGVELIQEATRLHLEAGDIGAAFASAERARVRFAPGGSTARVTLAELERKLAGTETAVLQLVPMPAEVVAICVTPTGASVARTEIAEKRLAALAAKRDDAAARELYDLLIRPAAGALAGARHLIVVAGPPLDQVAYAGLYDTAAGRYLIETHSVALAPSATVLGPARRSEGTPSVVAMALPADVSDGAVALPAAEDEIADVCRLYPRAVTVPGKATLAALVEASHAGGVIHLASHTERQPGSGDAALPFHGRRVAWTDVAATPLPAPAVVVLAACETLRRPTLPETRTLSLGGGFLAAGATDVIGTLTPIADNEARNLFRAIHEQLARGAVPADAVRRAQLDALAAEPATGRRIAWRSIALLTSRIANDRT